MGRDINRKFQERRIATGNGVGRDLIKVEGRHYGNEERDGVGQWAWQVCARP